MLIRVGFELVFDLPAYTPMTLMLSLHPDREYSIRRRGLLRVEPWVPVEEFRDGFGNRSGRLLAPPGRLVLWDDAVVEDSGLPDISVPGAQQIPVERLPPEVLVYLLGSRYCEVDRLSEIAWSLFGQTMPGWSRVQAVCNWVHHNVRFGYAYANPTKTAYDTFMQRAGVCRDFNQLALTFCRCLGIPARYATGYLGDIGVTVAPSPMDFSGWFEAYLDGQWYTFDARHNMSRIGRVVMARGRDAVDVALTTSFGSSTLQKFTVWTDEVTSDAVNQPQGRPEPVAWHMCVPA